MRISALFRRDKLSRFITAVRQEGWRAAISKARAYLAMERAGYGRSALPGTPGQTVSYQPEQAYLAPFWADVARNGAFHVGQAPATLGRSRRIAMIGDLNLPQCRKYRVEQPKEFWEDQGVAYDFSHYQDVPRSISILQHATHLMLYRAQSSALISMYLYEARRLRLPVLYDLDDPLFSVSAYETYENMKALPPEMKAHFLNEAPKYNDVMNMADIITVSTPGMRDHTRLYSPRPVFFRRNFADRATFEAADAALTMHKIDPDVPFRVGFASGSMGHEIDFGLIAEDMAAFLAADPKRQLVILGHFDATLLPKGLQGQLETHPFTTYDKYLENLATVNCAVMPLTDDIFNRCKSGVRVIDAAAVAVPSLVGTVSDMASLIKDGKTGRVLGPDDSWLDALQAMAADPGRTARMGRAARRDLEKRWAGKPGLPIVEPEVLKWVKA